MHGSERLLGSNRARCAKAKRGGGELEQRPKESLGGSRRNQATQRQGQAKSSGMQKLDPLGLLRHRGMKEEKLLLGTQKKGAVASGSLGRDPQSSLARRKGLRQKNVRTRQQVRPNLKQPHETPMVNGGEKSPQVRGFRARRTYKGGLKFPK